MKREASTPLVVLAGILLPLLLAACSTTEGSAYSASRGDDAAAAAAAAGRKAAESPPGGDQGGGFVFGGEEEEDGLPAIVLDFSAPPGGRVSLAGLPAGATVYLDGVPVAWASRGGADFSAAAGLHELRVSAFGRRDWSTTISVGPGDALRLEASLGEADFALYDLELSPPVLEARAPGSFGRLRVSWTATAPGLATLLVLDDSGRELARVEDLALDGFSGHASWDGRDSGGRPVAPGSLRIVVTGRGASGGEARLEGRVLVEESASPGRFASLQAGFSGALFAPDAAVLPAGRVTSSLGGYATFEAPGGPLAARLPFFSGIRAGGLFEGAGELALSAMVVPYLGYDYAVDPSWYSVGASLKLRLLEGRLAAAFLATASYASFLAEEASGWPPGWDGPTRFPSLGSGLVLETRAGGVRGFASAQLEASTYYPLWAEGPWDTPALFAWARFRAGAETLIRAGESGDFAFAVSGAARSLPLGATFSLDPPWAFGAELHWYLPGSSLVLSAYAMGEYRGFNSWYAGAGFGLGFIE